MEQKRTKTPFRTLSATLVGGLCGTMWWPASKAGLPVTSNLRSDFDRLSPPPMGDSNPVTFRDVLFHILAEKGGDFQDARFTADTVVRIERKAQDSSGKWSRSHSWERPVSELPDCADLVDEECYLGDFLEAA